MPASAAHLSNVNTGKFVELEPGVFVAGQLGLEDVQAAAQLGFGSIVCNRPDEESDHLPGSEIGAAAKALGIGFHALPVWNFEVTDEDVVRGFQALLEKLPRPVLFYCRSGRRSTLLWAQASLGRLGLDAALQIAEQAGQRREEMVALLGERAEPLAA